MNNENSLCKASFPENALKSKEIQKKIYRTFSHHGHLNYFNKGKILFQSDDFANEAYFIEKGLVRLFILTPEGKEVTLHIRNSGECFGLTEAILHCRRGRSAEVMYKKAAIWVMEKDKLNNLFTKDKELSYIILCQAYQHLVRYQSIVGELAILPIQKKVVKLLLRLSEEYGMNKGNSIIIDCPLTHEEIAKMVGSCRQRITLILNDLQKQGILNCTYKQIIILNIKKLLESVK